MASAMWCQREAIPCQNILGKGVALVDIVLCRCAEGELIELAAQAVVTQLIVREESQRQVGKGPVGDTTITTCPVCAIILVLEEF
jgi:hypothetical protein